MATIPLKDVVATVRSGGLPELSGGGISDSNGEVSIPLRLSEPQYNQLMSLTARGVKTGYEEGVGRIDTLPPYAEAKANGISMQIVMQELDASDLSVSPTSLSFPSTGGTQSVTITAPDSLWTIDGSAASSMGVVVTKISNTVINVSCSSGSAGSGTIAIKWGSQTRIIYITRSGAGATSGTVTFSGRVILSSTGAAIPSATVVISARGASGLSNQIATGVTDSSGNYAISWSTDSDTWGSLSEIRALAQKSGYTNGGTAIPIPSFDSATANGISVTSMSLALAASDFTVTPYAVNGPRSGFTQVITISGTDGNWVYDYSFSGGNDFANVSVQKTSSTTIAVTFGYNPGGTAEAVNARYAYVSVTWNGVTKNSTISQRVR